MMTPAAGAEARVEAPQNTISLTYSMADQTFERTKSLGIFNVSLELLHALARRREVKDLMVLANSIILKKLDLPETSQAATYDLALRGNLGRMWWDQFAAYGAARRAGREWLVLPKGFASFARGCPVRLAVYIHDVMQDHYDRHYPRFVPGLEAAYFRASLRASLRRAEIILTPTEFTLREIKRVAGEKGLRVPRMVCCGEGFERPAPAPLLERRDLVVLAGRFPHKLTNLAVEYLFRRHGENSPGETVHWIGSFPQELEWPVVPGWVRHPRMIETEFRALLSRSRVVVFFSDYEGFGRPPVEALLAGACPVYSDIPATREVMHGCGCPFENGSYASFAAALQKALGASPEQLQDWAGKMLLRHQWNTVAARVIEALLGGG